MNTLSLNLSRRTFLAALAHYGVVASLGIAPALAATESSSTDERPHKKAIPSSGERIPVIGMGTWITFNVGEVPALREQRTEIVEAFFARGGSLIDSSPMYGTSEAVVGHCLEQLSGRQDTFAATKIWTRLGSSGPEQMAESRALWGIEIFDLMQVHNLVNWQEHLQTLRAEKEQGRLRYIGVTTSHGRRHDELESIMRNEPIDFVQLTYNILDREAEVRLLPLAAERGIAVIANRPFRQKALIQRFEDQPLPAWAGEIDCENWPQFLLKFIVSHPDVTCAIPATTQVKHMHENMGALYGRLPDPRTRERMVRYVESL